MVMAIWRLIPALFELLLLLLLLLQLLCHPHNCEQRCYKPQYIDQPVTSHTSHVTQARATLHIYSYVYTCIYACVCVYVYYAVCVCVYMMLYVCVCVYILT